MLPKCLRNQSIFSLSRLALLLTIMLYALPAFSQDRTAEVTVVTAQTMLERFADQIPNLMRMTTAIAYVLGMYFIFHAVLLLKKFGEQRTMMSSGEHSIKGPLIYLTIGALLLYLPTSVQVGMSTFWTVPNPYGYEQHTDDWGQFLRVCFLIIQFIGTIAFIKGLVILSHLAGHGQQGTLSKGLTHIIGGILCINIYQTIKVITFTLGINFNV